MPAATAIGERRPVPSGASGRLCLPSQDFRRLLTRQGPSLGLWRAAEVAVLRTVAWEPPVLDLGCGDGLVTSMVLPRVAFGCDPDTGALARAARRGVYDRLEPVPVQDAALPDASIATVLSNSVLEHVEPLDTVLAAVARLLCPGGRLVFTVPTEAFSGWLTVPSARYAAWRNRQYDHRNLWPVARWAWHLERAGLTLEEARPYLRRGLVMAWDALDLLQQVRTGRRRPVGLVWRRIPPVVMARLAERVSRLDLSAPPPGGGRLMVARKG